MLPAATTLARVYYTGSGRPLRWSEFRTYGPLNFRWDHHRPSGSGEACGQERAVLYAAEAATTCLAEMFEVTRRIDRVYQAPWLVVFRTRAPLVLLDLTGALAPPLGSRVRMRGWVREAYEAVEDMQGIVYTSASGQGAPAVVLYERALRTPLFPPHPDFHRALADDLLLDSLKHAAQALGYALR